MNFLACDLGGTKVLLGIYEKVQGDNAPRLLLKEKYLSKEWGSFYEILDDFLIKKCTNIVKPKLACFAVAGVIRGKYSKITNLSWEISETFLKNQYNFSKVELANDFSTLIYGIPYLKENQYKTLQSGKDIKTGNSNLHAIIGAGTGLGISRGLIHKNKIEILSSEGGHVEFSPRTDEEWEIKKWLKLYLNIQRVSCERVISGEGLSNIARWRLDQSDAQDHPINALLRDTSNEDKSNIHLSENVCEMSKQGDKIMMEIEQIWLDSYASFIGDLAIHELCFGGLWITGGTASKHYKNFCSESFLKEISNKGRFKDIVKSIPIRVILHEEFGLHSAACRAATFWKK